MKHRRPVLAIQALQEQQAVIDAQADRIDELERRLDGDTATQQQIEDLEARLEKLE